MSRVRVSILASSCVNLDTFELALCSVKWDDNKSVPSPGSL